MHVGFEREHALFQQDLVAVRGDDVGFERRKPVPNQGVKVMNFGAKLRQFRTFNGGPELFPWSRKSPSATKTGSFVPGTDGSNPSPSTGESVNPGIADNRSPLPRSATESTKGFDAADSVLRAAIRDQALSALRHSGNAAPSNRWA